MTTKYGKRLLHSADSVRISDQRGEIAIQIFTDGGKREHGFGVGIAIFIQSKLAHKLRFTFHHKCCNNEAEQLAIAKELEKLEKSPTN